MTQAPVPKWPEPEPEHETKSRERPPTPPFLSNRRGFKPPGERILHVRIFLHESDFRGVPNDPESAAQVLMKDAFDIGLHNRSEALHPLCFCSV